jgi:glycosyltransferase involved in cell wall biosynthesis
LHWNHIRQLLEHGAVGSVHLHLTEATSLPTAEETTQWNITTSRWFEQPSDYAVLLQRFQIYFAPRRFEGIGMSFLEAMALGMAVVAPNNPTMNEYLVSGHNGFLYDPEHPQVPNWQKAEQWGAAARQTCVDGRQTWLDSLPALRAWLEREPKRFGGMAFSLRRSLAILRTRLRLVKRWVLSPRTDA